jgi:hypothetical protein
MSNQTRNLTWEEALTIEEQLNEITFHSIPLGKVLSINLFNYWWLGIDKKLSMKTLKAIINSYRYRQTSNKISDDITKHFENRVFYNTVDEAERSTGFFKSLAKYVNPQSSLFVGHRYSSNYLFDVKTFNFPNRLTPELQHTWNTLFKKSQKEIKTHLRKICTEFGLPLPFFYELYLAIIVQTQAIIYQFHFLKKTTPKAIITDHDRQSVSSCLIAVANELKIPTYTFIHGNTFPDGIGFYPVLASKLFCWGKRHYDQFSHLGTPQEKLIITGNTKLSRKISIDKNEIKKLLEIDSNKKVILLATNNIPVEKRHNLTTKFGEFLKDIENIQGIVRLHPAERIEDYQPVIEEQKHIKFISPSKVNFEESFALADVIAVHSSMYGLEGLFKAIPVIVLNVIEHPLFLGEELITEGGCPNIRTKEEMMLFLQNVFTNKEYAADLHKKNELLVEKYCYLFGDNAAKKIAETITENVNSYLYSDQ